MILVYDAGTGSVRAVLYDLHGKEIAFSQREWVHHSDSRYPNSMDFDTTKNWGLIKECTRDVLHKSMVNPTDILSISATSMREGFVLYNKDGEEIWACANVDARASHEVSYLKELEPGIEQELYEQTGQTFALGALPRLLWIKNNQPEIYAEAHTLTMINDWILYKLSGELIVDPSNGCTTGIFHSTSRSWDLEIARKCGIEKDIFPPVHEAGEKIGFLRDEVSEETGLATGTPILAGGGDAQLASIGVGSIANGGVFVCGGSFWQQEFNTSSPVIDKTGRVRLNCHGVKDMWQYETISFFPGLVMRWFRDAFCHEEKEKAKVLGKDAYELLEEEAMHVPIGSHGILPIFSDVMHFSEWKHAAPSFLNLHLDSETCGKKEIFRSLEENAALITYGNFKIIEELTGVYPTEVIFAGGASKGTLWSQILADVLGVPVKVPVVKEAAALGNAITSAVGIGIYESIPSAVEAMVTFEKTYIPNNQNHTLYQKIYIQWQQAYKEQLKLADAGVTSHMWKAPGM